MYYIKVKTEVQGFHRYKNAPEEVGFLRNFHRHLFKVEAKIKVDHKNRDEEFFLIKKKIDQYLEENYKDVYFEESCEEMAGHIMEFLREELLNCLRVEVSEDGENIGGVMFYG